MKAIKKRGLCIGVLLILSIYVTSCTVVENVEIKEELTSRVDASFYDQIETASLDKEKEDLEKEVKKYIRAHQSGLRVVESYELKSRFEEGEHLFYEVEVIIERQEEEDYLKEKRIYNVQRIDRDGVISYEIAEANEPVPIPYRTDLESEEERLIRNKVEETLQESFLEEEVILEISPLTTQKKLRVLAKVLVKRLRNPYETVYYKYNYLVSLTHKEIEWIRCLYIETVERPNKE